MSLPNEPDYVVVQMGNGATPEVFTVVCGIDSAGLTQTANTSDRFRRDCATPADVPLRGVRVTGIQWDLSGTGVVNMDEFDRLQGALGNQINYRILYGQYDGVASIPRTGTIIGYYDGPGVMTAFNQNLGDEGTAEIAIAGVNRPVWTEGAPA